MTAIGQRVPRGRRAGTITETAGHDLGLPGTHRSYNTASGCTVICALEPARQAPGGIWLPPEAKMIWHLSIAHKHRYPTWDEIADVRYELVPNDVTMAMLLPPMEEYVNLNDFCFHLWQIEDRRDR